MTKTFPTFVYKRLNKFEKGAQNTDFLDAETTDKNSDVKVDNNFNVRASQYIAIKQRKLKSSV